MQGMDEVSHAIRQMTENLLKLQQSDGSWRFCFENGILTDAYMIITLRVLDMNDESLIRRLHARILNEQQADGSWKVFHDEKEGSLSTTVDAYYALLCSGYSSRDDLSMQKAKQFILSKGGLRKVRAVLTKIFLAVTGQYPWPSSLLIPIELLLLPPSAPVSFWDFSGYARVHLAPMLLLADRKYVVSVQELPDLSELAGGRPEGWDDPEPPSRGLQDLLHKMKNGIGRLSGLPLQLHKAATQEAERYMLDRREADGTLYSYATSTFLMIYALLALGYDKRHSVITQAVQGLKGMLCSSDGKLFLQNSPSPVWDTALLSHALQEAGLSAEHPAIRSAAGYLIPKQQRTLGDWTVHNPNPVPGGWGFSETNTMNPDVDDTTAALRAIKPLLRSEPSYREEWNRGVNWVISMQNDDGGWPSFEKDTDLELLTWLPIDGAKAAAIDPSSADLTGRTLDFLGHCAGLNQQQRFIRSAADWLINRQEEDGSWYGRWGVCYIYGTWAALTGLRAVGIEGEHPTVRKAVRWLLSIQNGDGGWGESCSSDRLMRYVSLGHSTPSQTAWALDALIAVHASSTPPIDLGIQRLIRLLHEDDWKSTYPTGAGLPGIFYSHYHSYRLIWPLLTLSHYRNKYG
ncbi:squalene--hopene cyclase [Paenibacillus rigui]|uniref:Squalene--hopene cyclase n=1 Tax=Paenibacillus rigui TaxID=554312 RepID=A0A229UH89_9BACL|nr:squalene--hopene cyclase [Paenibacillus rigui]OXM82752.1 squalene--hopene cyclase [Paenibacillus rigui]